MHQKINRFLQWTFCILILSFVTTQLTACNKGNNNPDTTPEPAVSPTDQPAEATPLPPDPLAPPQFSAEGGFYDEWRSAPVWQSVPVFW